MSKGLQFALLLQLSGVVSYHVVSLGHYDTLQGRNHAVRSPHGGYVFKVPLDDKGVSECTSLCVQSPDCHGVVASSTTCYFRGGNAETPDVLAAQKTPDENVQLFVIYGKHK